MSDRNSNDMVFAVKDRDGNYYCGMNIWDKQLRKASLYREYKYAEKMMDDIRFIEHESLIVRVRIMELDEVHY